MSRVIILALMVSFFKAQADNGTRAPIQVAYPEIEISASEHILDVTGVKAYELAMHLDLESLYNRLGKVERKADASGARHLFTVARSVRGGIFTYSVSVRDAKHTLAGDEAKIIWDVFVTSGGQQLIEIKKKEKGQSVEPEHSEFWINTIRDSVCTIHGRQMGSCSMNVNTLLIF